MARAGAEGKALILLVTFFPQCVVSMLSMAPPVMASQIALSLGLSPQIAGVYVGLVYAGAILSSSFSASLITRLGPLRTSFACVVTGGAERLEDRSVHQISADGLPRIETEDEHQERRHQRAAAHPGHADQRAYAETQQNELPGASAHGR